MTNPEHLKNIDSFETERTENGIEYIDSEFYLDKYSTDKGVFYTISKYKHPETRILLKTQDYKRAIRAWEKLKKHPIC